MSSRSDDLSIRIKADDQASKTISKIAKDVDNLESKDATVDVKANTTQAESRIDAVLRRVKDLDDEDAEVILRVEAGRAEAEVRRLTKLLGTVDGEDAVAVISARDQASDDLQRVQAELNEIDGRKATATVDLKTSGFDKLEALAGKLPGIGSALSGLGGAGAGAAGVATGIGAAAVAAFKLAQGTAEAVVEVDTLAKLTGATVEETSKLSAVWSSTGADVKDLADVIAQVNGVLATTPGLADQLGISLKDANPQEVFLRAVDALNAMQDSQRKLVLGSQLFGEEGVRQVGAVTARYGNLRKAMEDLPPGLGITAQDATNARAFQTSTAKLSQSLTALGRSVGNEVVPVVTDLAEAIGGVVDATNSLVDLIPGVDGIGDIFGAALAPLKDYAEGVSNASDSTLSWTDRLKGLGQTTSSLLGFGQFTRGLFEVKKGTDDAADAIPRLASESDRLASAFRSAGSEIENQAGDASAAIEKIGEAYDAVRRIFDNRISALDLADQFDAVREAAVDAWGKTVDGSADAEKAQRNYQRELLKTQGEVATYAEQVLGLPPEAITKILADLDEGSVDAAEAGLKALSNPITVGVFVEMHKQEFVDWANSLNKKYTVPVSVAPRGVAAPAPAPAPVSATASVSPMLLGGTAEVSTTAAVAPVAVVAGQPVPLGNVTNIFHMPPGYDESRIVGQIARWQRRNGSVSNAGSRS